MGGGGGKMARTKSRDKVDYESLTFDELLEAFNKSGQPLMKAKQIDAPERIPCDYADIDQLMGGGVPRGRIVEFFGPESSSKTLAALGFVAGCQRRGGRVLWVETERTFDAAWAAKNGVNTDELYVQFPINGDEGYELVKKAVLSKSFDMVVVDSVTNMVPRAELEGEIGDANISLAARLNGQAMRHLTGHLGRQNHTSLILVNQIRVGSIGGGGMGPQNITTGGKAIPFYASVRAAFRRLSYVKKGEDTVVGGEFQMSLRKAKVSGMRPESKCIFRVDFEHGLDFPYAMLQIALDKGLITKSGSWYSDAEGNRLGQGEHTVKALIRESIDSWRKRVTESP
jgi:recombination protein RecA